MGIISRILSRFRRGSRRRTTRTTRSRRGLVSRLIAAVKAFLGGGRSSRSHRI